MGSGKEKSVLLFISLFNLLILQASAQFKVGHLSTTFTDTSRGRSIPVEIYYPADSAGDGVPVTQQNSFRFPVLAFGHGFVMTWEAYSNYWNALVPEGYIMIFPITETGISPDHESLGKDLAYCIRGMLREGDRFSSMFFLRIDSANAVMGHSMGGGASFLAAQQDTLVQTLVVFAPAETNPSAINAASTLEIPSLIMAGRNDCVTPENIHQLPMYNALASSCKSYLSIIGGSHCQMAESNILCQLGEASCTPSAAINRTSQHQVIFRYLIPWLDSQLKDDCLQGQIFDQTISADTMVNFQKTCLLCNTTENNELQNGDTEWILYPNPGQSQMQLTVPEKYRSQKLEYTIRDLKGRILDRKIEPNAGQVLILKNEVQGPGLYLIEVSTENRETLYRGQYLR